jgi:hypothetical protein
MKLPPRPAEPADGTAAQPLDDADVAMLLAVRNLYEAIDPLPVGLVARMRTAVQLEAIWAAANQSDQSDERSLAPPSSRRAGRPAHLPPRSAPSRMPALVLLTLLSALLASIAVVLARPPLAWQQIAFLAILYLIAAGVAVTPPNRLAPGKATVRASPSRRMEGSPYSLARGHGWRSACGVIECDMIAMQSLIRIR